MLSMGTVFHDIVLKKPERTTALVDIEEEAEEEPLGFDEHEEEEVIHVTSCGDSDEEWDTDLEDAETYGVYSYKRVDDPARVVYIAACKRLNIVPTKSFLKGLGTGTINVSHQGLGPKGTKALSLSLVKDRTTTILNMAGNMIGDDGIKYICEMLGENDIITHLDLSENNLEEYAASLISGMLSENDCLVSLNLSGNRFKAKDAECFAAILSLPSRHGLRELDLSHNNLGDEGATIIGHALADNETITKLNLSWNQIRISGIACISKGIFENTYLKVLDLSNNGVNNEGAACIAKALVQNRTLEELNLNGNRVGLDGVINIFKAFGTNDCLRCLRLTNNPLTLEGPLVALTLLLKSETSVLEELEIADACVPRQFSEVLKAVKTTRPQFRIHHGGFMDYRALCVAEEEKIKNRWKNDPMISFVSFIEERKLKLFDMFKYFDKDKSCSLSRDEFVDGLKYFDKDKSYSLSRDEFVDGLKRMSCPLTDKELDLVISVLDVDNNGEIDFGELLEVVDEQRKRLKRLRNKYVRQGSRASSATKRPPSRPQSRSQNDKENASSNSSTVSREDKTTTDHSSNQPYTPRTSLKSDDITETSSISTSSSSHDTSESTDNRYLALPKGHTVT